MADSKVNQLIEFWIEVIERGRKEGVFIHKSDMPIIGDWVIGQPKQNFPRSWRELMHVEHSDNETKFHQYLFPTPYMGDIRKAKIYYLTGNPGYSHSDYLHFLGSDNNYQDILTKNIAQKFTSIDKYKFPYLTPSTSHSGGYKYWRSRLKYLIEEIDNQFSKNDEPFGQKWLAEHIAVLELTGYHSASMDGNRIMKLKSTQLMLNFVKDYVIPRAARGDCYVIIGRCKDKWGLKDHNYTNVFSSNQYRSGYISQTMIKDKNFFEPFRKLISQK